MFTSLIPHCRDSHVHWLATGEVSLQLKLSGLRSPSDVFKLQIKPHHFRQNWLLGFGWDQNFWLQKEFPHRKVLDECFGFDFPVAFTRKDGHALWVNTTAMKLAGAKNGIVWESLKDNFLGGRIEREQSGIPSGVFIDEAMKFIDQMIPQATPSEQQRSLLKGMNIFNQAGFTHVRDMTCNEDQFQSAIHLEQSGILTLAVEQFFEVSPRQTFSQALDLAVRAKKQNLRLIRPLGIKVFMDGALGSEGAWLGCQYKSGSGHGLTLLSLDSLGEIFHSTWDQNLQLAVHVIGDEAVHQVILTYLRIKEERSRTRKFIGPLHLEHFELVREETLLLMKGLDIHCHLQPCHWLSDHKWLNQKINLNKICFFPWRNLQNLNLPFSFGSDSPIESPSVGQNLLALEQSSHAGVKSLLGDPLIYHSHPDVSWVPNCYTHFADGVPTEVVFDGVHLK
ncbi:MAG: amidohydrolase family protein [Bdellovibrionales bacterium]|nr:amidohydrolase family protein [Bdellovibrionales bacterium]